MAGRRVLILGLDCATPALVFEQWRDELPNIRRLTGGGIYGELKSTVPPITCPAWMSMMTSKNPGRLGFYGFRNRVDYSYERMFFATSMSVKEDTVWDILSRAGKRVIVVGVPQTYPPKPVNGCMITSFLTPSTERPYTYPDSLKREVEGLVGQYKLDVENFRTDNKTMLLREIYEMTEQRFRVFRHLLTTRAWDFAMMVEMGVDRIHHGFWKYSDDRHPKYETGARYRNAIRNYYRYIDDEIGRVLSLVEDDATAILVVSDHGAKRMMGGICINDWLIHEGYLALKEELQGITRFDNGLVDWDRTIAWGSGGYYGRLFLNVRGREPRGIVDPIDYERVRDELIEKLEAMTDPSGKPLGTRVMKPQEVYPECRGIPPDLIAYFGNLYWRSVGTMGNDDIHTLENDMGPDDANHDEYGIFILYDPQEPGRDRRIGGLHVMDVAPTVLDRMGLPVPEDMEGNVVRG